MIGTQVIRRAVFETNSSSMHSITVSNKKGVLEILSLDPDGITLTIDCDQDFGWGMQTHYDATTKAAYCVLDGMDLDLLEKVLKDQTGAKVIHYKNEDKGNIDHQSYGTAKEELYDYDRVRDFIFNRDSELEIDNDNH